MRNEYRKLAAKAALEAQIGKALEIGPGPGYISIELAILSPELQIIGLEISDTMIEIARNNVKEYGLSDRIELKKGDASKMPFEDSSFDFIISNGSLHHWKKPVNIFSEIHRVLKPGQKALISDLRKDAPKEKIEEFAKNINSKFMRWGLKHSFRESYTVDQIKKLLRDTLFTDFKINIVGDMWLEIRLMK